MRLFVAVVMFVMASFVFAAEIEWKSGSQVSLAPYVYPHESVPPPADSVAGQTKPQIESQNSQQNAGNSIPFSEPLHPDPCEEQNDALNYQSMEELKVDRKANEIAAEGNTFTARDNEIQAQLVIVGVLTIVSQVILTVVQICFIRAANRYAGSAAHAAGKSARSALKQTRVMENQMRPWVMVTPDSPGNWPPGLGVPFRFRFQWTAKNVGGSPAFLTRLSVDVKVVDWPVPDEKPLYPEGGTFAKFIIPPHGSHESRANTTLTPDQVERYMSGKSVVAFYGIVDYSDAFGPHCTRFFTYWGGPLGMKAYTPVGPPETVDYT